MESTSRCSDLSAKPITLLGVLAGNRGPARCPIGLRRQFGPLSQYDNGSTVLHPARRRRFLRNESVSAIDLNWSSHPCFRSAVPVSRGT
jgi:hypothetical protein